MRDRLDVSGSIPGLESSFQIIFFSCVAIQGTVRTEGKLQFGGEQGKPFWNCQELKQFGKRCRRKLPAWNDEMGALLQQKKLWLADYRLSDVDPSHAAFQMSPFTAASCTTESCMQISGPDPLLASVEAALMDHRGVTAAGEVWLCQGVWRASQTSLGADGKESLKQSCLHVAGWDSFSWSNSTKSTAGGTL